MTEIKQGMMKWMAVAVAVFSLGSYSAQAIAWPFYYCGVTSYTEGSINCGTGHNESGIVCGGMCNWLDQVRGCIFITDGNFSCDSSVCTGHTIVVLATCHADSGGTTCICY